MASEYIDGFASEAFHSKCDGKENTITIIKTNLNCIFGGYASSKWNNSCNCIPDNNAFIFSLKRKGVFSPKIFSVKDPKNALYGHKNYGPIFGKDILIKSWSNTEIGSYTDLGNVYNLPAGYTVRNDDTISFLRGNFNNWLTVDIEVYQVTSFI